MMVCLCRIAVKMVTVSIVGVGDGYGRFARRGVSNVSCGWQEHIKVPMYMWMPTQAKYLGNGQTTSKGGRILFVTIIILGREQKQDIARAPSNPPDKHGVPFAPPTAWIQ